MSLTAFAIASAASGRITEEQVMRATDLAELLSIGCMRSQDVGLHSIIKGVGLMVWHGAMTPFLLVDRSAGDGGSFPASEDEIVPAPDIPMVRPHLDEILSDYGRADHDRIAAIAVAGGHRHSVAPGSPLTASMNGRAGPAVEWGHGRAGFLTAGHVARTVGAKVLDQAGQSIGRILWSNDPSQSQSRVRDIDAALVENDRPAPAMTSISTAIAAAGSLLNFSVTGVSSPVFAFCDYVQLGSASALYGDVYLTDHMVTVSGDSGGEVQCNGTIAGMVIGAFTQRDMTVVQSIGYQLRAIRRRSGYMVRT